jgi:hypothetical protein
MNTGFKRPFLLFLQILLIARSRNGLALWETPFFQSVSTWLFVSRLYREAQ